MQRRLPRSRKNSGSNPPIDRVLWNFLRGSPVAVQFAVQCSWLVRTTLLTFVCAFLLDDQEFAAFATFAGLLLIFRPAAECGLTTVAAQMIARGVGGNFIFIKMRVLAGLAVYVVVFLISQLSGITWLAELPIWGRAMLCLGVAGDLSPLLMSLAQQAKLPHLLLHGVLSGTVILIILGTIVVYLHPTLAAIVILASVAGPVTTIALLQALRGRIFVSEEIRPSGWQLLKGCLGQTIADFITAAHVPTALFLIAQTGDIQSVVSFRMAMQFANLAVVTSQNLWGALRFSLNRLLVDNNWGGIQRVLVRGWLMSIIFAAVYAVASPIVIAVVFGESKASYHMSWALAGFVYAGCLYGLLNYLSPGVLKKVQVVYWQGCALAIMLSAYYAGLVVLGGLGAPTALSVGTLAASAGLLVTALARKKVERGE